ncbi:MAG: diguanylate cyclase [Desulfatitalea sp.]|nr:diguanylate cyclase [Desulfatitalea sp.]NNK01663.1 diguanylate cyclase [Desulfatitalea sp.]
MTSKETTQLLIIEDEPDMVSALRRLLTRQRMIRFDILASETLADGIVSLSDFPIDVVLLDLHLPDSQGLATLQRLTRQFKNIPIIIMTGFQDDELALEALRQGAQDFIYKSQMPDVQIIQSIRYAIERKQSELALAKSQERYRRLAETANDLIITCDMDGGITYLNHAALEALAFSASDMEGLTLSKLISEKSFKEITVLMAEHLSTHQRSKLWEGEFQAANGRTIPVEANVTLFIEANRHTGILLIARDISARNQTLVANAQDAHRLREIVENNADGMIVLNPQGRIFYLNPAAGALMGCRIEDLIGQSFGYAIDFQKPTDIEITQGNGTKIIAEVRATICEWENQQAVLCTLHDVTIRASIEAELKHKAGELEKMVEELARTNRQLIEQQTTAIKEERLKVLLQLADQSFYDINQPVNAIIASAEFLENIHNEPVRLKHHINMIKSSCDQIKETLKNMQSLQGRNTAGDTGADGEILTCMDLNILAVEDSDFSFGLMTVYMRHLPNIKLQQARSLAQATEAIKKHEFDLILLDYYLPDGCGLDFIKELHSKKIDIPVIVITGKGDEMVASKTIKAGAYDYLSKDLLAKDTVLKAIESSIKKYMLYQEVKEAQAILAQMSFNDELTGLYNLRYFKDSLERELSAAKRYGYSLVLCMLDLDHFKSINDTYGHPMGDNVLKAFSKLLKHTVRKSDIACRIGGEEFALILPHTTVKNAKIFANRFRKKVNQMSFEFNGRQFNVSVSTGVVANGDAPDADVSQFIALSDRALYLAKHKGRNRVECYHAVLQDQD